ncbi:MAG: hypothetical protein R6U95_03035 [Bacteroidales bacterium]
MTKRFCLILLVFSLLIKCTKDEPTYRLPGFQNPVITGYTAVDDAGNHLYIVGTPNTFIKHGTPETIIGNNDTDLISDYNSAYKFLVFPKPCANNINIIIFSPNKSSLKKIWIVKARYYTEKETSNNLGFQSFNSGGTPLIQTEFRGEEKDIDVSNLSDGYYRIYLSVDDMIFYDNLVVDKNFNL